MKIIFIMDYDVIAEAGRGCSRFPRGHCRRSADYYTGVIIRKGSGPHPQTSLLDSFIQAFISPKDFNRLGLIGSQ